jgi:hypothetical protein
MRLGNSSNLHHSRLPDDLSGLGWQISRLQILSFPAGWHLCFSVIFP